MQSRSKTQRRRPRPIGSRAIWLLIAISVALWAFRAEAATGPSRLPSGMGVQVQPWYLGTGDLQEIERQGFRFVRWGLSWETVETTPGKYDWSETDAFLRRVALTHLSSIVILGLGNHLYGRWIELPHEFEVRDMIVPEPPHDNAARLAFSRFAAAAAKRYAGYRLTWEIWNEPDFRIFWPPSPNPEGYGQLAGMTCRAIKAANRDATVLAPSTAALPIGTPEFFRALAKTKAAECLDGLSMHSYRQQDGRRPDPESVKADNRASRALLNQIFPEWQQLALFCTEWGYPTSAELPAETQAAYLVRTYLANLASGIAATVWYEWKDSRDEPLNPESHFGLKTASNAFKRTAPDPDLIRRLLTISSVRELQTGDPDIQALLFEERGAPHVVAWIRSDDPRRKITVSVAGRPMTLGIFPRIVPGDEIEVLNNAR